MLARQVEADQLLPITRIPPDEDSVRHVFR